MKVGVLSHWYDPETGSAALPASICRSIAALGHEVHVLTGFPNYPDGRLYPGYRLRPYQYEYLRGVHVHRVPLVPSHDHSALRRSVNYLSFPLSASLRLRLLRSVDVWLVYASPAIAAIPAMLARTLYRRPYVLLVEDLWPDAVIDSGLLHSGLAHRLVARALHRFCTASYRRASSVVAICAGMAELLASRGVPLDRLAVVHNWADESVYRPIAPDRAEAARLGLTGFVVMYAGSIGNIQALDAVVEASALLTDLPDVNVVFAGAGVAEQRLRAAAQRLPNVRFLGPQPHERMPALLANSQVQLISLQDRPLSAHTMPSKIQAVLASGRPMIGALQGDARRLVQRAGAGLVVEPGDAAGLAAAIRQLYAMDPARREALGAAGRQYYVDNLSERVGSAALCDLLVRAAGLNSTDSAKPVATAGADT